MINNIPKDKFKKAKKNIAWFYLASILIAYVISSIVYAQTPVFDNTKFTPALSGATIFATKVKYNDITLGELNVPGGIYCTTVAPASVVPEPILLKIQASGMSAPVRCIAYTNTINDQTGECYVKNFSNLSEVAAPSEVNITLESSGWIKMPPSTTTTGISYCARQSLAINIASSPPLPSGFVIKPLEQTPTDETALPATQVAPVLYYKKAPNLANIALGTAGKIFCKFKASAYGSISALPDSQTLTLRCFAYTASTPTVVGTCYVKDFTKPDLDVATAVTGLTGWTELAKSTISQPSYCAQEGGPSVVKAQLPLMDFSKMMPVPTDAVLRNTDPAPTSTEVKYEDTVLGTVPAGGAIFCKKKTFQGIPADKFPYLQYAGGGATFPPTVRCFAFTKTVGTAVGKCYIKDFTLKQILEAPSIKDVTQTQSGWTPQPSSTMDLVSTCGLEGGLPVDLLTMPSFPAQFRGELKVDVDDNYKTTYTSIDMKVLDKTPTDSNFARYKDYLILKVTPNSGIQYIDYSGGTFFCKSAASAFTDIYGNNFTQLLPTDVPKSIRCFAYKPDNLELGTPAECLVKNFTDGGAITNKITDWTRSDINHCGREGGPYVVGVLPAVTSTAPVTTTTSTPTTPLDLIKFVPTPSKQSLWYQTPSIEQAPDVKYNGITLGVAPQGGAVFCKQFTEGTGVPPLEFPKFINDGRPITFPKVRCFAYSVTSSSTPGKCYVKDFLSAESVASSPTSTDVSSTDSGWKLQPDSTPQVSSTCAREGGHDVDLKTFPPFPAQFINVTPLDKTPIDDTPLPQIEKLLYKDNSGTIGYSSSDPVYDAPPRELMNYPGGTIFCKTTAGAFKNYSNRSYAAISPNDSPRILRCFMARLTPDYPKPTCLVYDFKEGDSVALVGELSNDTAHCIQEGGPYVEKLLKPINSSAIEFNQFTPKPFLNSTIGTIIDDNLKYGSINLNSLPNGTSGGYYCFRGVIDSGNVTGTVSCYAFSQFTGATPGQCYKKTFTTFQDVVNSGLVTDANSGWTLLPSNNSSSIFLQARGNILKKVSECANVSQSIYDVLTPFEWDFSVGFLPSTPDEDTLKLADYTTSTLKYIPVQTQYQRPAEINLMPPSGSKYFCKSTAEAVNVTSGSTTINLPKLTYAPFKARCFAYSSFVGQVDGKCFVKDMEKGKIDSSIWPAAPLEYCESEGGPSVKIVAPVATGGPINNKLFLPKIINAVPTSLSNDTVLKYGEPGAEVTLANAPAGGTVFCKTTTAKAAKTEGFTKLPLTTPLTDASVVRCFIYKPAAADKPLVPGTCYIKDFTTTLQVTAPANPSDLVASGWTIDPFNTDDTSYCGTEGGTAVAAAVETPYLVKRFNPAPIPSGIIDANFIPGKISSNPVQSSVLKYRTSIIASLTGGLVFCRTGSTSTSEGITPAFSDLEANKVRCFAITKGTHDTGGDCYVKDFDENNYNVASVGEISADSSWKKLPSTTLTKKSYCDQQGGWRLLSFTKPFPAGFSIPVLSQTPDEITVKLADYSAQSVTYTEPEFPPLSVSDNVFTFCKSVAGLYQSSPKIVYDKNNQRVRCFRIGENFCSFKDIFRGSPRDFTIDWAYYIDPSVKDYCAKEGGPRAYEIIGLVNPNTPAIEQNKFSPTPLTSVPSSSAAAPKDAAIKYGDPGSQITLASAPAGGAVFCKKITTAAGNPTASFPVLTASTNTIRCFVYTPSTSTDTGSCYIKDFSVSNDITNPVSDITTGDRGWTLQPKSTTSTPSYCAVEGGSAVNQLTSVPYQERFSLTLLDYSPVTAIAPEFFSNNPLIYNSSAGTSLTLGTLSGGSFFCKTEAKSVGSLPAIVETNPLTQVRCFAFVKTASLTPATCYVKDFKMNDMKAVAGLDGWSTQVGSYCLDEGGPSVSTATPPANFASFDLNKFTPEAMSKTSVLTNTPTDTIIKFGATDSQITVATAPANGAVFCKKETLAAGPDTWSTVFPVLTSSNTDTMRCFAFTKGSNTVGGNCYVKDFNTTNYTRATNKNITEDSTWKKLPATSASTPSYCDTEGGVYVLNATKPFTEGFSSKALTQTPDEVNTKIQPYLSYSYLFYKAPGQPVVYLTATSTSAAFFCKTNAEAVLNLPKIVEADNPNKIRCFMLSYPINPINPLKNPLDPNEAKDGRCWAKDFERASMPTGPESLSDWVDVPDLYCNLEGGPAIKTLQMPLEKKFNIGAITGTPAEIPEDKKTSTLSYNGVNLGTIGDGGSIFCKTEAAANGTFGVLPTATYPNAVRCFAYTPTGDKTGLCYVKDFLSSLDVKNTIGNVADSGSGWKLQVNSSLTEPSYCAKEGGESVNSATALSFPRGISVEILAGTPSVAMLPEFQTDKLTYSKGPGLPEITLGKVNGKIFCKSYVSANGTFGLLPTDKSTIRCFAYNPSTTTAAGECYVKDITKETATVDEGISTWKKVPSSTSTVASYCSNEGGPTVVDATKPPALDSQNLSLPIVIGSPTTIAAEQITDILKYADITLGKAPTNGGIFCKTTATANGTAFPALPSTALPKAIRCFAFSPSTDTQTGKCYLKDFKTIDDYASVEVDVTKSESGWVEQTASTKDTQSYCAKEGGASINIATAPPFPAGLSLVPLATAPTKDIPAESVANSLTYKKGPGLTGITLGKAVNTDTRIFCKNVAAADGAFVQLPQVNKSVIRCFAFIPSTYTVTGTCYVKDFDKTIAENEPDLKLDTWKSVPSSTLTKDSYCGTEGGPTIIAALKPVFTSSDLGLTIVAKVPPTTLAAEQKTTTLMYNNAPLATLPSGTTGSIFCKKDAAASTPFTLLTSSTTSQATRCFAYTEGTSGAPGVCYVKDFKTLDDVNQSLATPDVSKNDSWKILTPAVGQKSYCANEGGASVNTAMAQLFPGGLSLPQIATLGTATTLDASNSKQVLTYTKEPGATAIPLATAPTGGVVFCKTSAGLSAPVPTLANDSIRCFAYTPSSTTVAGVCKYKDFNATNVTTSNATVANITNASWQTIDNKNCINEGGSVVASALTPVFTFNDLGLTVVTKVPPATLSAEQKTESLTYNDATLARLPAGATGGIFCKKDAAASTPFTILTSSTTSQATRCFAYTDGTSGAPGVCYVKDFKTMDDINQSLATPDVSKNDSWKLLTPATGQKSYCALEGGLSTETAMLPKFPSGLSLTSITSQNTTLDASNSTQKLTYTKPGTTTPVITLGDAGTDGKIFCKIAAALSTITTTGTNTGTNSATLAPLTQDELRCYAYTPATSSQAGKCYVKDITSNTAADTGLTSWTITTNENCITEGGGEAIAKLLAPTMNNQANDGVYRWGLVRGLINSESYLKAKTKGLFCSNIDPATNTDKNKYILATSEVPATSNTPAISRDEFIDLDCQALCSDRMDCAYYLYSDTPTADKEKCYLLTKENSYDNCPKANIVSSSNYEYFWKKTSLELGQQNKLLTGIKLKPISSIVSTIRNYADDGVYRWGLGRGLQNAEAYLPVRDGSFCSTLDPLKNTDKSKYLLATSVNNSIGREEFIDLDCQELCSARVDCAYYLYPNQETKVPANLEKCYLISKEQSLENCKGTFMKETGTDNPQYRNYWKKINLDLKNNEAPK